ncbi:hypothetical protein [Micromonospora sp. M71_S20]|uniref:hypothetical protein n=1 Tax=Micromonospora sp. M71_S20 TaxID=592872 RepID=UPI000EAC9B89|nr:hypothetical protein [Micromonospora sp. M71_S20]
MSSYRDPAPQGDVFPSEEEIDPTGTGPVSSGVPPVGAYPAGTTPGPKPAPPPTPPPRPVPHPGPAPRAVAAGGRT